MSGPVDISNFTKSDPENDSAAEQARALAAEALLAPLAGATFSGQLAASGVIAIGSAAVQTLAVTGSLATTASIVKLTVSGITLTLSTVGGRLVFVKNLSAGVVTLAPAGGWTVNETTTYSLGAGLGVLLYNHAAQLDTVVLLA